MTLDDLVGSRWQGTCELWEDPLGDVAKRSDCTIAIDAGVVSYTWSYADTPHRGSVKISADGGEFSDSWHQQEPMTCSKLDGPSLAQLRYSYMGDWGWRINLCHREPTGELVLQMTNIAPWGEEARAVRMTCKRTDG